MPFAAAQAYNPWAAQSLPRAESAAAAARTFLEGLTNEDDYHLLTGILTEGDGDSVHNYAKYFFRFMRRTSRNETWSIEKAPSAGERTATVTANLAPAAPRDVICVYDQAGGWKVDAVATYQKWTGLSRQKALLKIFLETGVEFTGLPKSPENIRYTCQSQLKQLARAYAMYSDDYDERLPPARTWQVALEPYVKTVDLFTCPQVTRNGYAMNASLSMAYLNSIQQTAGTVALYDTRRDTASAFGVGFDVSSRHLDGANYAYADGHVKWHKNGDSQWFNLRARPRVNSVTAG